MSTRRDPERELTVGELRSALSRALAEIAELRGGVAAGLAENSLLRERVTAALAENARHREKVTELERRVSKSSGSGGRGGSGGSGPFEVFRKNTQAARDARARRTAARAHAEQVVSGVRMRGRGRRTPRPAMPVDREMRLDVPADQLPADARPNGWVPRRFQCLGLERNSVALVHPRSTVSLRTQPRSAASPSTPSPRLRTRSPALHRIPPHATAFRRIVVHS